MRFIAVLSLPHIPTRFPIRNVSKKVSKNSKEVRRTVFERGDFGTLIRLSGMMWFDVERVWLMVRMADCWFAGCLLNSGPGLLERL